MTRRLRRNFRNPLWRRRFGCALILFASAIAGAARLATPWLWAIVALALVVGVWFEAKTSDGLLTVGYPGGKRRSLTLAAAGLIACALGLAARSLVSTGVSAALIIGGLGFFVAGGGTLAWHSAATYAGDRIVKLSDEDW